jgi:hypothetical protein
MSSERREGSIDLFRKHGAREFVREGHRRERQKQVCAGLPFGRQAVVTTHQKNQILSFAFSFFHDAYECLRVHRPASRIEKYLAGGRMFREEIETLRNNLAQLTIDVAAGALQEFGGHAVRVDVACFPDIIEEELHWPVPLIHARLVNACAL